MEGEAERGAELQKHKGKGGLRIFLETRAALMQYAFKTLMHILFVRLWACCCVSFLAALVEELLEGFLAGRLRSKDDLERVKGKRAGFCCTHD